MQYNFWCIKLQQKLFITGFTLYCPKYIPGLVQDFSGPQNYCSSPSGREYFRIRVRIIASASQQISGLSRTFNLNFQDFPGPKSFSRTFQSWKFCKKFRTFQEAWKPCY